MKSFIKLVILAAVAGLGYESWLGKSNPEVITHPVYGEMRVDVNEGGRELNVVLYGRAVDRDDCEQMRTAAAQNYKGKTSCIAPSE